MTWQIRFNGEYRGETVYAEDAAAFVAFLGEGATISNGPHLLWTEGEEDQPASESYDHVANVVHTRLRDKQAKHRPHTTKRSTTGTSRVDMASK
jgi:hypothetical protein